MCVCRKCCCVWCAVRSRCCAQHLLLQSCAALAQQCGAPALPVAPTREHVPVGSASEPGGADLQGARATDQGKLEHSTRASDAGAIVHTRPTSQLGVGGGLMMGRQGKEAVASQLPLSCTKYYLSLTTLASHPHPPASTTACCRHETKSQTCGSREVVTRTQQSENVCNKSERGQSPCLKLRVPMPQHQS